MPHQPPRNRPGDEVGEQHRPAELPEKQRKDLARVRAQRLADPDLLGSPLRRRKGQADEAKAGEENGEAGKNREELRVALEATVQLLDMFANEGTLNLPLVTGRPPEPIDLRQRLRYLAAGELDRDQPELAGGFGEVESGIDRRFDGVESEIRNHGHHLSASGVVRRMRRDR